MIRHQKAYLIENKGPLVMVVSVRPRDLAIEILKDDKNWTAEKIDIAMNRRVERTYNLKPKYPCTLVILRFDSDGQIHFYKDIYDTTSACLRYYYPTHKKTNPFIINLQ
jgi:murein L,D-transpeptidase YcbB/YkuD